ncbi:hypothetical protein LCGC14_1816750 [marine sediment metagenome]|uniref:Uncharacterized protein n=1 Tax=marine sediment metagenome TaxID=412755 RepID=A0A0F9JJP2_9ZZZZ
MDEGQPTGKKADTILDLSQQMGKMLVEHQNTLDGLFRRNPEKTPDSGEVKSLPDNVLDEIISQLESNRVRLTHIMNFLSSDVLSKIT